MRTKRLCLAGACLTAALLLVGQGNLPGQDNKGPKPEFPPVSPLPPPGPAPAPGIPAATPPQTIEQLLDSLAQIRAKMAELVKQEQEVIKSLRAKLKEQQDRLTRMGIVPGDVQTTVDVKGPVPLALPATPQK